MNRNNEKKCVNCCHLNAVNNVYIGSEYISYFRKNIIEIEVKLFIEFFPET